MKQRHTPSHLTNNQTYDSLVIAGVDVEEALRKTARLSHKYNCHIPRDVVIKIIKIHKEGLKDG